MTSDFTLKRVVLSLHQAEPDQSRLRLAAELAELLRLDLSGIYIEDPNLLKLAGIPGAREFQLLSRQWQAIGGERLARELELRLRAARRLFAQLAEMSGGRGSFEVMRAATADMVASMWGAADIVVVAEPRSAAERFAQPFAGLTEAALRSQASVLILPSDVARKRGPIVAVSAAPGDPSIGVAGRIAMAASERLIVIEASKHRPDVSENAIRELPASLRIERVVAPSDVALLPLLERLRERFVVMTRDVGSASNGRAERIASLRGVPVLALGATQRQADERQSADGAAA